MTNTITLKGIKETKGFIMRQLPLFKIPSQITEDTQIKASARGIDFEISVTGKDEDVLVTCKVKDHYFGYTNTITARTLDELVDLIKTIKEFATKGGN